MSGYFTLDYHLAITRKYTKPSQTSPRFLCRLGQTLQPSLRGVESFINHRFTSKVFDFFERIKGLPVRSCSFLSENFPFLSLALDTSPFHHQDGKLGNLA